jgi:hypothetical protein
MSGELPFIDLNGVELANGYRTLEYLRRGLGGPKWEVPVAYPCSVLAREIGGVGPFISPSADPAPWYDATVPESSEFLGLVSKLDFQTIDVKRSISQRFGGIGGGVIGVEQFAARGVKVEAMLIASSCAGLEYGRHWVYSRLGADCAGCSLGTLRVRESCPPADGSNDARGERIIYDAALVEGITRTDNGGANCCDYDGIDFSLAGQSPYLYSRIGASTSLGDVFTVGGALVPPSPTVLDTFVRANTGPPPSASWTGGTRVGEANTLRVLSNVLDNSVHTLGTTGSAYWNAATFGPDVAVTVVVPTRVNSGQFAIRARILNPGLSTATYINAQIFFSASPGSDSINLTRVGPAGTDFFMTLKAPRTYASGDTFMLLCRGRSITVWRKPSGADWIFEGGGYDPNQPVAGNVGLAIIEQGATQTLGAFGAQTQTVGAYPHDVQSIIIPSQSIGISSPIVTISELGETGTDASMQTFDGVRIQAKPLIDGGCSITDTFSVDDRATKWWGVPAEWTITGGKLKPAATGVRQLSRSLDGTFANRVLVPGGHVEAKFTLGTTLVVGSLGVWGLRLTNAFGAFLIASNNTPLTNTFALGFDGNATLYQDTTAFTPVAGHTYRIILEVNPISPLGTYTASAWLIDQATPTQMACRPLSATFSSLGPNPIIAGNPALMFSPGIQVYAADVAEAYDDFFFIDNSDASAFIDVGGPAGTYIVDASRRVVEYTDRFGNPSREGSGYASSPIDTPLGWVDQCAGAAPQCLQIWGDVVPSGSLGTTASVAMQNRVR